MTDYEATRRDYRWQAPKHYNFAVDTIGGWPRDPDLLALWWIGEDGSERKLTFAELSQRSDRVAAGLRAPGIKPGDRVLVMLPRTPRERARLESENSRA
jgi:acyl-coenzyme A synthetase/AMP-(fatty) acid ligase